MPAIQVVVAQHKNNIDMTLISQIRKQESCIEFLAISTNPELIIDQLGLKNEVEVTVIDTQLTMTNGFPLYKYIREHESQIPIILIDEDLDKLRAPGDSRLPPGIFMAIPSLRNTHKPDEQSLLQKGILIAGNSYRHSQGQDSCCAKHYEKMPRLSQPNSETSSSERIKAQQELAPQRKMPTNLEQIISGSGYSPPLPYLLPRFGQKKYFHLLAIGASTGGPEALKVILRGLPANFPAPILLVQHISANFIESFTESVGHYAKMPVELAANGKPCRAGTIYMVPNKIHLGIQANSTTKNIILKLSTSPPTQNSHMPSVGYLFDSIAQSSLASSTVAIIMSGMGEDGAAEIGQIKKARGIALAQDESSSVVFGMPKLAIQLGNVHREVPLHLMPGLVRHLFHVN